MPLPDIPEDDYRSYQADQFSTQADQRINALSFSTAANSRIAMLDQMYAPPSAPDMQGPPSAGSETEPSVTSAPSPPAMSTPAAPALPAPDAPVTVPLVAPSNRPLASPSAVSGSSVSQTGDPIADALNTADRYQIDPHLFLGLLNQESGLQHYSAPGVVKTSPAGARGIGQLMPDTARGLGVNPDDPAQNLDGAARYLRQNLDLFGGDVVKALAAYNAGAGNVQKYGGIPPFKETQTYVDSILSKVAKDQVASGPALAGDTLTSGFSASEQPGGSKAPATDISQFGDPQLTSDEAYAACGPAAAVRFAQRFGRNPTLREATDLAKQVGWTKDAGMAGLNSEKTLMDKLGIPTKIVGADWGALATEAQTGNPVTISIGYANPSAPGHYFFADNYDPSTGKFHVGRSGLDLKAGAEWMTPAEMVRIGSGLQGGLLADNPQAPAPSTADQSSNPGAFLGRAKDAIASGIGNAASGVQGWFDNLGNAANTALGSPLAQSVQAGQESQTRGTVQAAEGVGDTVGPVVSDLALGNSPYSPSSVLQGAETAAGDVLANKPGNVVKQVKQGAQDALTAAGQTVTDAGVPVVGGALNLAGGFINSPTVMDSMETLQQITDKYGPGTDPSQMTPEDRQAYGNAMIAVGGVVGPVGGHGVGSAPRNIPERPVPEGARPINLTPAEETSRLRLEAFPEDVRQTIADSAQGIDWARTQRRGVIPDDVAQQMAEEYAANHSLDQVIRNGAAGKAYTTEEIRALRNATAAQAVKVNDAAAAISAGDDSSAALADFFQEGQRLQRLVQISEGARAEAGRSLRAYQDPAQLVDLSPTDAIARITRQIGGDRQKLLDAVTQYRTMVDAGSGPVQLANFWSSLQNPVGAGDWFKLIRYNSMLSGPRSFEINAVGNALELPWRFARDAGASLARLRPEELQTELTGAWAGLDVANRRFMETITQGITSEAAAKGEIPRSVSARLSTSTNPAAVIGRPVAAALEVPGRLMGAADEWANAIAYSMGLGRLAARQASREGLRGPAWNARVSHILSEPTVAPKLMEEASAIADRMTFHGEMGNFGQGLQAFTQKTGVLGNLILPFLRTVYHITARGIDRSPVGLLGTGIDVARGVYREGRPLPKGVAPLGERLGDNLMGSAVFLGMYKEALDGNVSAAGPDDPGRRSLLQSEGWQPYSIRVGDKWISYANWGPAAIPFALAGAASEAQRYAKAGVQPGEMVLDGMRRTAQVVTQQTYLQAIGAAWQGLTDPQRYGFQFVNNTIGSLIPYGAAINTVGQATDPYARRPDKFDIGDAIRNRLPANTPLVGGRESVPTAQDVLGRPAPNMRAGMSALNPLLVSQERADPVLRELDATGVAPPGSPSVVTRNGRPVALTPDEQRQVQSDAGGVIADRVTTEMQTQSYQTLEPQARQKRLQRIIDNARTQAENRFLGTLSDADYQQRIQQSQTKRELVPISGR